MLGSKLWRLHDVYEQNLIDALCSQRIQDDGVRFGRDEEVTRACVLSSHIVSANGASKGPMRGDATGATPASSRSKRTERVRTYNEDFLENPLGFTALDEEESIPAKKRKVATRPSNAGLALENTKNLPDGWSRAPYRNGYLHVATGARCHRCEEACSIQDALSRISDVPLPTTKPTGPIPDGWVRLPDSKNPYMREEDGYMCRNLQCVQLLEHIRKNTADPPAADPPAADPPAAQPGAARVACESAASPTRPPLSGSKRKRMQDGTDAAEPPAPEPDPPPALTSGRPRINLNDPCHRALMRDFGITDKQLEKEVPDLNHIDLSQDLKLYGVSGMVKIGGIPPVVLISASDLIGVGVPLKRLQERNLPVQWIENYPVEYQPPEKRKFKSLNELCASVRQHKRVANTNGGCNAKVQFATSLTSKCVSIDFIKVYAYLTREH